jgi:acetylornithine aminotransferase
MAVGDHGTTFGGNPLGARVAHHIVTRLSDRILHEDVKVKSDLFLSHFRALQDEFPELVKEVRGRGLLLGLQLTVDPAPIVKAARERGLLVITAGTNTLRFVPPLTISETEIEEGMETLKEAMRAVVEGRL